MASGLEPRWLFIYFNVSELMVLRVGVTERSEFGWGRGGLYIRHSTIASVFNDQ